MTELLAPTLRRTPLHALHVALGARMAPFAGYDMPIHYAHGIIAEHEATRTRAGLFDVSHMGQAILRGPDAARRLETLAPGDIVGLAPGRMRYTQFTNAEGGIIDDLIVTRLEPDGEGERLFLVVNAACKAADFACLADALPDLSLDVLDRALIAVQGPMAAAIVDAFCQGAAAMPFMSSRRFGDLRVSRCGYTGEDGFEISVATEHAEALARALIAAEVEPVGLGARDTLRLEAGLCLYGHDLDATISPVEAALIWSIGRRRVADGGFPGAARLAHEIAHGPARRRIGLMLEGKGVAREGAEIATPEGAIVGRLTSGGVAPSLKRSIGMGYVEARHSAPGSLLAVIVRGRPIAAIVTPPPFVPHRHHRAPRAS